MKKRGLENLPFLAPTEMARMCPQDRFLRRVGAEVLRGRVRLGLFSITASAGGVAPRGHPRFGPRKPQAALLRRRRLRERGGEEDWVLKALHRNTGELLVSARLTPPLLSYAPKGGTGPLYDTCR